MRTLEAPRDELDGKAAPSARRGSASPELRRSLGIGEGYVTLTDEAGLVVAVAVLMKAQQ